jgi:type I restriction enzyme R subunit
MNEADTRYHLIDPVLRTKGYVSRDHITLETVLTPAPVEPSGAKGRRRKGPGRTDYLLCVQVGDMPKPMPIAVLEAKREGEDPLKGMQQARGYADTLRFDVKYVFSTNGHKYGEYDRFSALINGPFLFPDFPAHADLRARYYKGCGIDLTQPSASILFQVDSPAWSQSRYYQDAAIRAAFEKVLRDRRAGSSPRVLLTLATGAGKTIIATNLLWRLSQAGQLPQPALFLCDRDELREQAYTKLKAAFGDNVRIVRTENGGNAAANARVHIATYQTLGLDDDESFASFLSEHYGENSFSIIIIDECHRSAWGRWSEVLRRNPNAIHIGLTATPRKLDESKYASPEDQEITANNRKYFGEPVYEYTLIQAQEDGYLAACEIVKRKASIDNATFTREELLAAGARDVKTGKLLIAEDLIKDEYTGKDFDDEVFIELRILPRGTVCFSRTASVGFVAIMGRPMATSQDFANWVCGDKLDPDFLMLALIRSRRELRALATGATHKTIYMPTLEAFHICLPDLVVQRRIVATLQAQLAIAHETLQAAKAQLEAVECLPDRLMARAFQGQ